MWWNNRVVRKEVRHGGKSWSLYSIHEVYYADDGTIELWTQNPVNLGDYESVDDLKGTLELVQKAFDKPVLEYVVDEEGDEILREIDDTGEKE